jgi:hypothetical protein
VEAPHNFDKTEDGAAVCVCGISAPSLGELLPHIGEGNQNFHDRIRREHDADKQKAGR